MEGVAEPVLRFFHYAVLLGLFGASAFLLIGSRTFEWFPHGRGMAPLVGAAVAAPLVALALMLVAIAGMMGSPVSSLDWPITEAMIQGTDMGRAFLVRLALVSVAAALLVARKTSALALPAAVFCYGAALVTLGWSGHAAATEGGLGLLHRLNNGVHLLAAGLWLGAISGFLYLVVRAHRQPELIPQQRLLSALHGFAPFGGMLVGVVGLTGLISVQLIFGLENSMDVLATGYGWLLATKVVAVLAMLGFGARNAMISRRFARSSTGAETPERASVLAALRASLARELACGFAVVGLVAILGMLSPLPAP